MLELGALSAHATYDDAGRLLFRSLEAAQRFAQARAYFTGSRQRVTCRDRYLTGYRFHVGNSRTEAPAATEAELLETDRERAARIYAEQCPHGRSVMSRLAHPCPPGLEACKIGDVR